MRGGRLGGMGRGGFGGGIGSSSSGGGGINPMLGLAGLGMFGMMFRNQNRQQTGGNKNKLVSGTITVSSPKGGENWIVGSTQTLIWTSDGVSGNVKIELSRDGGSTWNGIVESTPVAGNQTWNVTGPATTQAKVRVSGISGNKVSGITAANFTISSL